MQQVVKSAPAAGAQTQVGTDAAGTQSAETSADSEPRNVPATLTDFWSNMADSSRFREWSLPAAPPREE